MANTDYLEMSDEEVMNAAAPDEEVSEVVNEDTAEGTQEQDTSTEQEETNDSDDSTDEGESSEESNSEPEEGDESESAKPTETQAEVDYKAEMARILAPFKANGREIEVKSVDDAISLMQMGANYNKKMAALKPNLKLMKLLENNGLLSEEKIGFLIDLEKRNPDAINKLVKDSGLDPLELDTDKAGDYKPSTYTVDDREMELDSVLDELQATPTYNQTLNIVSNKWDGASKQVIANSPQLLKVINSHVASGIYDLINKEIESERVFGRLDGLSDIEAYRQVGDAIQARGGFNQLAQSNGTPAPKPVVVPPKPKADDDKLREKKRAASSTKPTGVNKSNQEYNPLSMSDDAFTKLVNESYL